MKLCLVWWLWEMLIYYSTKILCCSVPGSLQGKTIFLPLTKMKGIFWWMKEKAPLRKEWREQNLSFQEAAATCSLTLPCICWFQKDTALKYHSIFIILFCPWQTSLSIFYSQYQKQEVSVCHVIFRLSGILSDGLRN